jgi:hypothetical protein
VQVNRLPKMAFEGAKRDCMISILVSCLRPDRKEIRVPYLILQSEST